jgi:hypothetical protein
MGSRVKVVARIHNQGTVVAKALFYLINQCFLAGKPPRLIRTSPTGCHLPVQPAVIDNPQFLIVSQGADFTIGKRNGNHQDH